MEHESPYFLNVCVEMEEHTGFFFLMYLFLFLPFQLFNLSQPQLGEFREDGEPEGICPLGGRGRRGWDGC